jgi:hypothetical protein
VRAGAAAWSRLGDGYWIGLFGGQFGFIPEPKPHLNTDLHGYRNRNRNRKTRIFGSARFGSVYGLKVPRLTPQQVTLFLPHLLYSSLSTVSTPKQRFSVEYLITMPISLVLLPSLTYSLLNCNAAPPSASLANTPEPLYS